MSVTTIRHCKCNLEKEAVCRNWFLVEYIIPYLFKMNKNKTNIFVSIIPTLDIPLLPKPQPSHANSELKRALIPLVSCPSYIPSSLGVFFKKNLFQIHWWTARLFIERVHFSKTVKCRSVPLTKIYVKRKLRFWQI